jgi:hypothetical protein
VLNLTVGLAILQGATETHADDSLIDAFQLRQRLLPNGRLSPTPTIIPSSQRILTKVLSDRTHTTTKGCERLLSLVDI